MTRHARFPASFIAVVGIIAGGCRPTELRVPLAYQPTTQVAPGRVNVPPELRLAVTTTDERTEASAIGQNTEHPNRPIPVFFANRTPDEFLDEAVSRILAKSGFKIVAPKQANRILALRLRRFWTEEQDLYRTVISADAELRDPAGAKLWEGQTEGRHSRFGMSLSFENYEQSFSDATFDLVQALFGNEAFVKALTTERDRVAPAN